MQHNKRLQKIGVLLLFSATHTMFGQFNTLSPQLQPEKKKYEKYTIVEVENKEKNAEKKGQNTFWKKLFQSEKASLRKENDSLKRIIAMKEQQSSSKHIADSLLLFFAKKAITDSYLPKKEEEKKPQTRTTKIAMPINGDLQITSPFGERFHPIWKENKLHNGIDLRANHQFVYAVLDGVISGTGWDNNGGGNFIKIQHSNGLETSYCHLSEVYYQQGEAVKAGFVIARSGNTGNSTAPHLHFSVKEKDKYINPVNFLNDLITINNSL